MKRTKRAHKVLGPIIVMGIITFALMILSVILSLLNFHILFELLFFI